VASAPSAAQSWIEKPSICTAVGASPAVTRARTRMLSLPVKVAPQVAGLGAAEIKDALENAVHEALAELATASPAFDEAVDANARGEA
jgi:hypothetical protein